MKDWRVFPKNKPKALAAIATSVVHTFPDGLKESALQYQIQNSPMKWLHSFDLSKENKYLVSNYDQTILKEILSIPSEAIELLLGFWEDMLKDQISIVKNELGEELKDNVSIALETLETENQKICKNGHVNKNVRSNRRYCINCKATFVEDEETNESHEEDLPFKRLVVENEDNGTVLVKFAAMEPKEKSDLYKNCRNIYSPEAPIIECNGAVLVNPNTFARLIPIFDYMKGKPSH